MSRKRCVSCDDRGDEHAHTPSAADPRGTVPAALLGRRSPGVSTLAGAGALTKLALRRDRLMLAIWVYALTAFVAFSVYGLNGLYSDTAARLSFISGAAHNPAFLALYGPLYGTSIGSLTAWRDAVLGGVGTGLLSIFLVIRHTRGDEEAGRLELVGSAVVGRHAALVSALLVACGANVALGLAMAAGAVLSPSPLRCRSRSTSPNGICSRRSPSGSCSSRSWLRAPRSSWSCPGHGRRTRAGARHRPRSRRGSRQPRVSVEGPDSCGGLPRYASPSGPGRRFERDR